MMGGLGIQGSVLFQCHAALPMPSLGHVGMRRSLASQETSQLYLNRKKEVFSVIQCPGSTLFIERGSTWDPGTREHGAREVENRSTSSHWLRHC